MLRIDTIRPAELNAAERGQWALFRAADPALASPYFDVRYTQACGQVCPDAQIAVIHQAGEIAGFLPFQRRGGLMQPLGAPLTDYHGVIARPGAVIDLSQVVKALGAGRFQFSGLTVADGEPVVGIGRRAMLSDVSGGFEAYLAARKASGHGGFLKDKRRRRAALERDHGPVEFSFGA